MILEPSSLLSPSVGSSVELGVPQPVKVSVTNIAITNSNANRFLTYPSYSFLLFFHFTATTFCK